jgi:hypothetical protein
MKIERLVNLFEVAPRVISLRGMLVYDTDNPLAVVLLLQFADEQSIKWEFARELLHDGALDVAGIGDVRIWPNIYADGQFDELSIMLSGLDSYKRPSWVLLTVSCANVLQFLARTYMMVPKHSETDRLDIQMTIDRILENAL